MEDNNIPTLTEHLEILHCQILNQKGTISQVTYYVLISDEAHLF